MQNLFNKKNNGLPLNFYNILDLIPICIYWKDKDGSYLGCNKSLLEVAGLEHLSEVIGKKDNQFLWKSASEKITAVDKSVIENKKTVEVEEVIPLSKELVKIFLSTKTPVFDPAGEVTGLIGISIDITERKKSEENLLEHMRRDIRRPLMGIIEFASVLKEKVADPSMKEYIESLIRSSYALRDLLNETLETIKANSGKTPILFKL